MGLFGFIMSSLDEHYAKQQLKKRSISGSDERLKHFVERYPGEVIDGYIPISCHHVGLNYSNTGHVAEHYVRLEYFDGRTRFMWFDNISDAILFKNKTLEDGEYAKVVGPHSIYGAFL